MAGAATPLDWGTATALDRWLMHSVLAHSSSPPAREAAGAWIAAYDAARLAGLRHEQAQGRADAAYRRAAARAGLPLGIPARPRRAA
jgi:hypothetical protein